jgi:deoxycytidylate deaminase
MRSLDPHTKHGTVVVGKDKVILSVGYNSPPRGSDDANIPLTRPEKYKYFEHSESNSIINAARSGVSLLGSTFYVTGCPCVDCLRKIINVGADRLVYGFVQSACISEDDIRAMRCLLSGQTIKIEKFETGSDVQNFLSVLSGYVTDKLNTYCNSTYKQEVICKN